MKELFEKPIIEIVEQFQKTRETVIKNKYEKIANGFAQSQYEKVIMGRIASAADKDGKAIYSNDTKRQAEFAATAATDADYLALKELNKTLSEDKDNLYMRLDVLEKIFEAKKLEMELRK